MLLDGRWARWLATAAVISAAAGVMLAVVVARTLPDEKQIRALADSQRVTTLFDAADRPIFTIYKQERVEVPLRECLDACPEPSERALRSGRNKAPSKRD